MQSGLSVLWFHLHLENSHRVTTCNPVYPIWPHVTMDKCIHSTKELMQLKNAHHNLQAAIMSLFLHPKCAVSSKFLALIRGQFNKYITNRDWKESNGDNDIKTTFTFKHNLHTNLNICPTISQDGDPPLCSDGVFDALQRSRCGDLHWPTGSMFVFDTCPPFWELLHSIMDCLTWQAIFTVHGQHFFVDILCFHFFCPQKKRTTPRCSIAVHVLRGAAIL